MEQPQQQTTVIVKLTLRVGSDPIAGELGPAGGPARPFVGWIALVRSIEDATAADLKEKHQ
jgi:hypothetical protein